MTSDKKYVHVPIEPTEEMLAASNWPDSRCIEIYQAMVMAAPPCAEGVDIPEIPPENLCPYNDVANIGPFVMGWNKCREYFAARKLISVSRGGEKP